MISDEYSIPYWKTEKKRNNYQDEPKGDGIAAEAPVADWSDMKMFDDDHDPDWFEEEEKRLGKYMDS